LRALWDRSRLNRVRHDGFPKKRLAFLCGFETLAPLMKSPRYFVLLLLGVLFLSAAAAPAVNTIVVDAGHGGHDRGGGPGQRIPEKPYTLDTALRLRARLRAAGFRVVMTRDGDYFVGLRERCQIANSQGDAVFVSIHFNSAPREGASGIETYYYSRQSASLAAAIHPAVVRNLGAEDRHVRVRGYYVLRHTDIPAVLVEGGFLTNYAEGERISGSSAYRQRLADTIASVLISRYR
jgi:N-acetylmuramoyl-L-alanine amidase